MLSRRFLATAFGAATLVCAAGLAIAPGAASAGIAASGRAAVRHAAASIASPGGPIVPAVTPGHVTLADTACLDRFVLQG